MKSVWIIAGVVAALGFESCSSVTVLRTREIKKINEDAKAEVLVQMRHQLDSLKVELESLRSEQQRQQKRLIADVSTLSTRLGDGFDQQNARNEEILFRLDQLAQGTSKPTKRVVVSKQAVASTGAPAESVATPSIPPEVTPDSVVAPAEGFDAELEKLYMTARSDFQRSEYKLAYDGFKQIFEKSKTGSYAENALYWMGQCLVETAQNDKAMVVFQRSLELFPRGKKSCVVLMKLAELSDAQGKKDDQLRYLQGLTSQPQCHESNEAYRAIELLDSLKSQEK